MRIESVTTFGVGVPAGGGRLLQLKPANHPDILRLCEPETSNFVHYKAFTERGGLGDVHQFARVGSRGGLEENWLLDIQPPEFPRAQLHNKLINDSGEAVKVNWYISPETLVFGYCAPGCNENKPQSMRVKTNADGSLKVSRFYTGRFTGWPDYSDFVEPDGVRRSDIGRDVAELIDEGRVLYWYEFGTTLDKITRSLGGLAGLKCPMWSHDDFPVNQGRPYFALKYFAG